MVNNAYFLAKIGADTAENERNFAEILPKIGNYPTARRATRPSAPPVVWDGASVRGAPGDFIPEVSQAVYYDLHYDYGKQVLTNKLIKIIK